MKQKGISLIALIIAIIAIVILAVCTMKGDKPSGGSVNSGKIAQSEKTEDYEIFHKAITVDIPAGSIPVFYNGQNWIIADTTKVWYDYREEKREWANIITVNDEKRAEYQSKKPGTVITDEQIRNDVIGMFVYIPRYAYQITSNLHNGGENIVGNIDIKFINKENQDNEGRTYKETYPTTSGSGTTTKMDDFVVHPVFTDNISNGGWNTDLNGIWVGKFESSSSTTKLVADENYSTAKGNGEKLISTNIYNDYGRSHESGEYATIRPGVTSWRYDNVGLFADKAKEVAGPGNKHGLTDSTSHLMKNSEWGAVAYLTQSKYGNKNVYNNSYYEGESFNYTTLTGMCSDISNDTTDHTDLKNKKKYNTDGSIEIEYTSKETKTFYPYNHERGYNGSSTKNIYGIYDLAGGSFEYVAGYITGGVSANYSTYVSKLGSSHEKNSYSSYSSSKFGDAIYETSNSSNGWWNNAEFHPTRASSPFFVRGGYFDDEKNAGVFYFDVDGGYGYYNGGFRVVVVK